MNMRGKRKIGRKILAFVLAVCMLFSVQPNLLETVMAQAADGGHGTHSGWTALKRNTTTLTAGTNYYLTGDTEMSSVMTISGAGTVNLCLNGHDLTTTYSGSKEWLLTVPAGVTLNVYDCAGGGSLGAKDSQQIGGIRAQGELNVYGGSIRARSAGAGTHSGFRSDPIALAYCSGIYADSNSVVTLYGGSIEGKATSGVYVESGARLSVEGANVECEADFTSNNTGNVGVVVAAIYVDAGGTAEVKSGRVRASAIHGENMGQSYIYSIMVIPTGRLTVSDGEIDATGDRTACVTVYQDGYWITETAEGVTDIDISGGTITSVMVRGDSNVKVNVTGGEITGYVFLMGGAMELAGNQKIGTASEEDFDIMLYWLKSNNGKLVLTGDLTNPAPYKVKTERSVSSQYPHVFTEGFGTFMAGKTPSDYFTSTDGYKVVLLNGEAAFVPYVMTFDANGGSVGTEKGDINGSQRLYALPEPTREHYQFGGWYTEKTGGERITIDTMPSGKDVTVYAHWTPVNYDITYELAGGALPDGGSNPVTYHIETPAFTLMNPVRAGYVFTGWSGTGLTGEANKTVKVPKGSAGEREYTAHWEEAKYKVTVSTYKDDALWTGAPAVKLTADSGSSFVTNLTAVLEGTYKIYSGDTDTGVTVTVNGKDATARVDYYTVTFCDGSTKYTNPAPQTVLKGKTAAEPSNPAKTGYTFQKWVTANGGSTVFNFNTPITNKTSIYAGWKANTYTVMYNGNGSTGGSTADSAHAYGTAKNLTANGYKKEYTVTFNHNYPGSADTAKTAAYTFAGWNTAANGSGVSYSNGQSVTNLTSANNGTVTLYAKWTPQSVTYAPTRTGYTFAGWYAGSDCSGSRADNNGAYTPTENKTLYAKWTADQYDIAYSGLDNATLEIKPSKHTYGTATTVGNPAKTGYAFAGWKVNGSAEAATSLILSATGYSAEIALTATWTPISYTIAYDLDHGTAPGNPATYTIESGAITLVNPSKDGFSFTGWSGTDLTGSDNMSVTIPAGSTENREYTAHWTAADYKVTLNGNGGSAGTSLISYSHGTEAPLPTDWTRTGYAFAGWHDNKDCAGTAETKIPDDAIGDKEYWAKWTLVSYSISYDLDGGTAPGNPATYTIESDAITLANPTKEGHAFTGWSGTGLDENTMTVTMPKGSIGDRAYTAHWKLADYAVALHTNGGAGGTGLASYTYKTGAVLPTDWKKTGYVFDGWYDNEDCSGTAVTNISGTATGNKEYWAKWTDNIAPVIGTLSYDYQPKNLWQWLIGKDSLVITVPVTEEGSGADNITYTETPDGGTAREKTANITDGKAEITVSADFKGTISIACTDKANNTSASVTVGAGLGANGIIIEDNAPQIAFTAENAELLPSGEYKTVPDIAVTVADDKNNAISGGIASVSYQINGQSAKTVAHDYTAGMVVHDSFTIPASEISAGETEITVTATDNAGNSVTQNYTVKAHSHSGTLVPAVEPTCTTAGNKEYYACACGKEFSDSGCANEITDHTEVVKNALGHDFTGKYQFDTEEHWKKCSRCPATDSREAHSFEEGGAHCTKCDFEKAGEGHTHTGELHDRVEPTCTTKGNIAYYTCNCGKWFSDNSCTVEITDKSKIEIAALEHDFVMKHDQNEHWQQCSRCGEAGPKEAHVYDSDTDTDCNQCGYRRTVENPGNVSKDVEKDEKAPDTVLSDSAEELADIILTEEEKGQIENGEDIKFILDVKDAGDTVAGGDKTAVQSVLRGDTEAKEFSVGQYLDISLFKVIGETRSAISQTTRKLTIVINVPDSLKSKDGTKPRTYAIIRVHDGVAEVLADSDDNPDTITIATDRFSAYALVYKEAGGATESEPVPEPDGKEEKESDKEKRNMEIHSGLKATQTGKNLQISWGRVSGADGYSVYVQYCGKEFGAKSLNQVKSGKKTKITVKKVNGKKLDTTKNFKLYVVAWQMKNGKKSVLTKTLTVHVAGKDSVKYTNVKSIRVKKTSYTLKKGGSVTLRPKAVLHDKRKKQLSLAHCKEFRYLSSDKKVATVTSGGKVKAKGPGSCVLYVFAKNGCKKKIKIIVS